MSDEAILLRGREITRRWGGLVRRLGPDKAGYRSG